MIKKYISLLIFLFSLYSFGQSIRINDPSDPETNLTAEEILQEVLISGGSECADISLISISENPGGATSVAERSWGYFNSNGFDFPFEEGIIFASGLASEGLGPNTSPGGNGNGDAWQGDSDLQTILDDLYGTNVGTDNATAFEFTFSTFTDIVSFRYFFASEEYENQFECNDNFRDGFAFLVRGPGIPDDSGTAFGGTNIAAIPGSNNIPVSTLTIHSDAFMCGVEVEGDNFFPEFYASNIANQFPTEYDGLTVPLQTQVISVTPGETYTMKIVIADRGDPSYNSAVFLEAGSLNIGVDLGNDLIELNGTQGCPGETITLDASANAPDDATYEWFFFDTTLNDFVPFMPPETNPTLDVEEDGEYKVEVSFASGCVGEDSVLVEFVGPTAFDVEDLTSCDTDGDGFATFDTSNVEAAVIGSQDPDTVSVTYEDGNGNALPSPLPDDLMNSIMDLEEITAIITSSNGDCTDSTTFNLVVLEQPAIGEVDGPLLQCDPDGDGFTSFDTTGVEDTLIDGQPDVTISYTDGSGNTFDGPLPNPLMNTVADNETITVTITNAEGCQQMGSFDLEIQPQPVAVDIGDQFACDTNSDGIASFNLVDFAAQIIGTQDPTVFSVSFHMSMADAQADQNAIMLTDDYMSAGETLWARLDNSSTPGAAFCEDIISFDIGVLESSNVNDMPTPFEICDSDNDGIASFTLSEKNDEITGGDTSLTVEYYLTQAQAEAPVPSEQLDQTNFTNNDPFMQQIWVRVINAGGCETIFPLDLIVLNTPLPNLMPEDYVLCDFNEDTFESFDLSTQEAQILDGLDPSVFTIMWFETLMDAEDGTPTIGNPSAYVAATGTTVYAVVTEEAQSDTFRCPSEPVALTLVVSPIPAAIQPANYELCDDDDMPNDEFTIFDLRSRDDEITGGDENLQVSYHLTEADANTSSTTNPLPDMYQNEIAASQTIYVRVEDITTGCHRTLTLTLVVVPLPSPMSIPPIEECDDDTDGIVIFDLTIPEIVDPITNGEPVILTFHETEAEAILGTPFIDPANAYPSGSTTLWVRATYDINNPEAPSVACFTVISIELQVHPLPEIPAMLEDLVECDDDGDGAAIFDLSQQESAIYGSQNPDDFDLSYHETQISAESDPMSVDYDPIADPVNYLAQANATIYVQLYNPETECLNTGSFEIMIQSMPSLLPPADPTMGYVLEACDNLDSGDDADEITTFDLTQANALFTDNLNYEILYFENLSDVGTTNFITPIDAYESNGNNPQTLHVTISSDEEGMCVTQTSLQLTINPLPVLADPIEPFVVCDEDNDGFDQFILDEVTPILLDGQANISLAYYETLENAENEEDAIDPSMEYSNIVQDSQVIYVGATNTMTGCSKIYPLTLETIDSPVVPLEIAEIVMCDEDNDGFEIFDLTVNESEIYGTQDPANFTLFYYLTEADALAGDPAQSINNDPASDIMAYQNTSNPQTIWVRLEFVDENACASIGSFDIRVEPIPVLVAPQEPLEMCDDGDDTSDGIATFDLTEAIDTITGGADLLIVEVYPEGVLDAGGDPIDNPESYESGTQTVDIVVTNLAGCSDMVTLTLRVLNLPTPDTFTPDTVMACDDDTDGIVDTSVGFDLTDALEQIDNSNVVLEVYETEALALEGDAANAISDTSMYINTIPNQMTLYVRVEHQAALNNPCFVIVELPLEVSPAPVLSEEAFEFPFCEPSGEATGLLDLDTLAAEIGLLVAPQNPDDFEITYYETQAQADAGDENFELDNPYEITGDVTIYVRVEDASMRCFSTASISITQEVTPEAGSASDIYSCTDDASNQGVTITDLTQQDASIINGSTATNPQVVYYTTEADAMAGTNPITDPTAFENTINPQTIYGTLVNEDTPCASEPVPFMIIVNELPEINLGQGGPLCVDITTGVVLDPVILDGTPSNAMSGVDYSYNWTLDGASIATTPTIDVTLTGTYQVTVTANYPNADGTTTSCEDMSDAIVYTPTSAPTFTANVVEDNFSSSGLYTVLIENIQGFPEGSTNYEFKLDDGPWERDLVFSEVRPGTHIITGRSIDNNDCGEHMVTINIIDYPRFFTPNGDGYHDTWNIVGIGQAPNLNAEIYIFDRHGKLLKQLSPTGEGWDGTAKGAVLPSTDYWFRVEYNEFDQEGLLVRKQAKGHFTLKR